MSHSLFHLAFPVSNIFDTKRFYVDGLGCQVGRENAASIILNLRGNQLVAHVTQEPLSPQQGIYPRHFGLIFTDEAEWRSLLERAEQHQLHFYQSAKYRFSGTSLEHSTFFLEDPFFNLLEFKHYRYSEAIFGETAFGQIGDAES
ncbi:VOC family protein [Leptolyngbyaceae cyanobacterium UHCC 1019]